MVMNITFIGRIGREIEEQVTKSGKTYGSLRFAVDVPDSKRETPFWITGKIFEPRLLKIKEYFKKGKPFLVSGRLLPRAYLTREGNPEVGLDCLIYHMEFIPFSPKNEETYYSTGRETASHNPQGDLIHNSDFGFADSPF